MPGDKGSTRPVRYVLHLAHSGEGVSGWVEKEGRAPQAFSSWLELLSLLESADAA